MAGVVKALSILEDMVTLVTVEAEVHMAVLAAFSQVAAHDIY